MLLPVLRALMHCSCRHARLARVLESGMAAVALIVIALLLVAGALTFMAYGLQSPRDKNNAILAAALIIVVTLTCLMSYLQERSASSLMGELVACCSASCTMLCDHQAPARKMKHE